MKENAVVCWPGPARLFFMFRFEYLVSGPKELPGLLRNGPMFASIKNLASHASEATTSAIGPESVRTPQ